MSEAEDFRIELMNWYAAMVGAGNAMPKEKQEELKMWEAENLDGFSIGTSDWPGWDDYILRRKPVFTDEMRARDREGFVYLVRAESGEYKIGRSKNVEARLRNFRTLSPLEFELLHSFYADHASKAESELHKKFTGKRIKREWFSLDGVDVSMIMSISKFEQDKFI